MDPVSAFIVTTIIGGIMGNRADALTVSSVRKMAEQLGGSKIPINHDLQRAVLRAFHLSATVVLREFIDQQSSESGWKRFFINTPEVSWARDVITALKREIKSLSTGEIDGDALEISQIDARQFLISDDHVFFEISDKDLTQRYLSVLQKIYQKMPEAIKSLFLEGWQSDDKESHITWYNLVSAFFVEELKTNERLRQVFQNQMRTDFSKFQSNMDASIAQLSDSGAEVLSRLEELKQATKNSLQQGTEWYDLIGLKQEEIFNQLASLRKRNALIRRYGGQEARRRSEKKMLDYREKSLCYRADMIRQIDRFIGERAAGRLVITAPAGLGKSALLSDWIEKRERKGAFICRHFFTDNGRRPLDMYTNLLKQLYGYYDLEDQELPADEDRLRDTIVGLIMDFGANENEGLIIVIDGLDESEDEIEGLLAELPTSVYLIFSYRAGREDDLESISSWMQNTDQIHLGNLSQKACENWLMTHPRLKRYSEDIRKGIIDLLYEVTSGYPLYLNLLIEDEAMYQGDISDNLRQMPHGLRIYVKRAFQRIAKDPELRTNRDLQLLFAILAVANAPLSTNDLEGILGVSRWELSSLPASINRWFNIKPGIDDNYYSFTHLKLSEEFRRVLGRDEQKAQELIRAYCEQWRTVESVFIFQYFPRLLAKEGQWKALIHLLLEDKDWLERKRFIFKSDQENIKDIKLALAALPDDNEANSLLQRMRLLYAQSILNSNFLEGFTSGYLFCEAAFGDAEQAYLLAQNEGELVARLTNLLTCLIGLTVQGRDTRLMMTGVEEVIGEVEQDLEGTLEHKWENIFRILHTSRRLNLKGNLWDKIEELLWKRANMAFNDQEAVSIIAMVLSVSEWPKKERWKTIGEKIVREAFASNNQGDFPYALLPYGDYEAEISTAITRFDWDSSNREYLECLLVSLVKKDQVPEHQTELVNLFPSSRLVMPLTFSNSLLRKGHFEEWEKLYGHYQHLTNKNEVYRHLLEVPLAQWPLVIKVISERVKEDTEKFLSQVSTVVDYVLKSVNNKSSLPDKSTIESFLNEHENWSIAPFSLINQAILTNGEKKRFLPLLIAFVPDAPNKGYLANYLRGALDILLQHRREDLINDLIERIVPNITKLGSVWKDTIYKIGSFYPDLAARLSTEYKKYTSPIAVDLNIVIQISVILAGAFRRLNLNTQEKLVVDELLKLCEGRYDDLSREQSHTLGMLLASLGYPIPDLVESKELLPYKVGALLSEGMLSKAVDLIEDASKPSSSDKELTFFRLLPRFEAVNLCVRYWFDHDQTTSTLNPLKRNLRKLLEIGLSEKATHDWSKEFLDTTYPYEWAILFSDDQEVVDLLQQLFRKYDLAHKPIQAFNVNHAVVAAYLRTGENADSIELAREIGWLSFSDYNQMGTRIRTATGEGFNGLSCFPRLDQDCKNTENALREYIDDLGDKSCDVIFSHVIFILVENQATWGGKGVYNYILDLVRILRRRAEAFGPLIDSLETVQNEYFQTSTTYGSIKPALIPEAETSTSVWVDLLLGDTCFRFSDYKQAISHYQNARQLPLPSFLRTAVLVRLGYVCSLEEDYVSALEAFDQALNFDPQNYAISSAILITLITTKELDVALNRINELESTIPDRSHTYAIWRCYIHLARGDHHGLAQSVKSLKELNKQLPEIDAPFGKAQGDYYEGLLNWQLGKETIAKEHWQRVVTFYLHGAGIGSPFPLPLIGVAAMDDSDLLSPDAASAIFKKISSNSNGSNFSGARQVKFCREEANLILNLRGDLPNYMTDHDLFRKNILELLNDDVPRLHFEHKTSNLSITLLQFHINSSYFVEGFTDIKRLHALSSIEVPVTYQSSLDSKIKNMERLVKRKTLLKEEAVILLKGTSTFGEPIYSYLKLKLDSFIVLRNTMMLKRNFYPHNFGEVVASGTGYPPVSVRVFMRNKYHMVEM